MSFFQMSGMNVENPWNVQSLYDLQFFNCPSQFCIYKSHSKQEFLKHAFSNHPESEPYLINFKDDSLSDVDFPLLESKVDSNLANNVVKIIKTEQIESKVFDKTPVVILDHLLKTEIYCEQCDIYFCNQKSLQEHENSIHPYLEIQFKNDEEDGFEILDNDDIRNDYNYDDDIEDNYNEDNCSANESYKDYNFKEKEKDKENSAEIESQSDLFNTSEVCQVCSKPAQTEKYGRLRFSWHRNLCSQCHWFWQSVIYKNVLNRTKLETIT